MTADTSKAALYIRKLAFVLLLLLPVAALGTKFGLWHYTIGLLLCAGSLLGSLLIQIINAIWLLRKPSAGTKTQLRWASLYALPPLAIFASILLGGKGADAPIHNISTDLQNPPAFVAALEQRGEDSNPLAYSPEVAAIQSKAYPELKPIISNRQPAAAFEQALNTLDTMGLEVYAQDPAEGRIEAVATTFWFGYKDDMVVRIQPHKAGSRIDLRSVSRVGQGDLGANAKRINRFTEIFTGQ